MLVDSHLSAVVSQLRPDGHQRLGEILWRSLLRVPRAVSAQSHRVRGRLGRDHRRHRVLGGQEFLGGVLGGCAPVAPSQTVPVQPVLRLLTCCWRCVFSRANAAGRELSPAPIKDGKDTGTTWALRATAHTETQSFPTVCDGLLKETRDRVQCACQSRPSVELKVCRAISVQ